MSNKKPTIDDIFDDDDFGLLDVKPKVSSVKSEEDRLVDAFEEISAFVDKNNREPSKSNMSEYSLLSKLKNFRESEGHKQVLKPFDRHNLLGHVEVDAPSIDDILDDELLDSASDLSIFKYTHTPKPEDRAEADFVAKRTAMKEKDFLPYEAMFHKVHNEIKEGKRKIRPFKNAEKNLEEGNFYLLDGLLLFLENADLVLEEKDLKSGNRVRHDGRTRTIFENGTYSNMLFRSLGKRILKDGKLITQSEDEITNDLFVDVNAVEKEDVQTGWIYVLKSSSTDPKIAQIKDLYKIGFSSTSVDERIKNAKNEATYLFADVKKIAVYKCYNRNADKLESLLHRFFARACLDIDLFDGEGKRLNPREWFVVPFGIIEEVINQILNGSILNYEYDPKTKTSRLKE